MSQEYRVEATGLAELLHGAVDLETTPAGVVPLRLPLWSRAQDPSRSTHWVASCAAGIRLRTRTRATWLVLRARLTRLLLEGQEPAAVPAGFAVVVDGEAVDRLDRDEGDLLRVAPGDGPLDPLDVPAPRPEPGEGSTLRFDLGEPPGGRARDVEIWFPHNARVELLGLTADAPPAPAPPPPIRWLHYGSSISHCLEADGPLGPWPHQVARRLGVGLTSIGLAGGAMLDPFAARAVRDADADVISLKVGINLVNGASMTARTFAPAVHGFLDTVRERRPATPILLISAVACPMVEKAPGPTRPDGAGGYAAVPPGPDPDPWALTLDLTRRLLRDVHDRRSATDPHLHFLDGTGLLGLADADRLYDDLHPDQKGYDLMADRFTGLVRSTPELAGAFGL